MAKPSKAYLELMEKFKQNEEREHQIQLEAALEKQNEKRIAQESFDQQMEHYNREKARQSLVKEFGQFQLDYKTEILENVLTSIVQKALPMVINEGPIVESAIREFVEETGTFNILNRMKTKTQLLSELAEDIEDAYEDGVEDADPDVPSTYEANKDAQQDLISKIEGDETIDDVTDIIKSKVSRATDEFIEKNVMDQTEIKDTLQDAKRRMESVRTGDDALDEEIRQEHTTMAKRKINSIRNKPHTVFEQLVTNITESVIKSDFKDQYIKEDGKLNMDKIVDKATAIYTVMETLNTLKLKDFTVSDVDNMIQFG